MDDDYWPDELGSCAASDWRTRWPKHCAACGGWGGTSYQESHGFRGGGSETIFEPCGAIDNLHTCHRCGHPGLTEDGEGPCTACGWDYDDGVPGP